MKAIFLVLVPLVFCINSGYAQNYIPYYNLTNQAEYQYDNANYQEAEKLLQEAFHLKLLPFKKDVLILADIYCKTQHSKKAFRLIMKYQRKGMQFKNWSTFNTNSLQNQFSSKKANKISDTTKIKLVCKDWKEQENIQKAIIGLAEKDREQRTIMYDSIVVYYQEEDSIYKQNFDMLIKQDSINAVELISIFKTGKLPSQRYFTNIYLARLLIHFNTDNFRIIEPYLLEQIAFGTINPMDYATISDRIQLRENQTYKYLTYGGNTKSQISLEQIKKNRIEIGLSPYYSHYYATIYYKGVKNKKTVEYIYNRRNR